MPKYYCDYCDTYLTHDSPSVRKTHFQGRKHNKKIEFYYQKWMEEQAQNLIDATTATYKVGKNGIKGVCKPPSNMGQSALQMFMPPGSIMSPGQLLMGAPPMMSMPPIIRPPMGQMPMMQPLMGQMPMGAPDTTKYETTYGEKSTS